MAAQHIHNHRRCGFFCFFFSKAELSLLQKQIETSVWLSKVFLDLDGVSDSRIVCMICSHLNGHFKDSHSEKIRLSSGLSIEKCFSSK